MKSVHGISVYLLVIHDGILFLSTFLDMLLSDNIVEYMVEHGIHGAW